MCLFYIELISKLNTVISVHGFHDDLFLDGILESCLCVCSSKHMWMHVLMCAFVQGPENNFSLHSPVTVTVHIWKTLIMFLAIFVFCLHECVYMTWMSGVLRSQKQILYPVALESQMTVSHKWVLRTNLRTSAKAVSAPTAIQFLYLLF